MSGYASITGNEALKTQVGARGSYTVADTDTYHAGDGTDDATNTYLGVGRIRRIVFITASAFDTDTARLGGAVNTGVTYPAGFELWGDYSAVQLASGSAELYP